MIDRIPAKDVAEFVAEMHGLTMNHMRGSQRSRWAARPRQIAMYAIHRLCPHMSYATTGHLLGGRDHTTVLHGVRKIESLVSTELAVAVAVERTLVHFARPAARTEAVSISAAVQFHTLCEQYGQAMKAAA